MGFQKCRGCYLSWVVLTLGLVAVMNLGAAVADPTILDFFNSHDQGDNKHNGGDPSPSPSPGPRTHVVNSGHNLSEPDSKYHVLIEEVHLIPIDPANGGPSQQNSERNQTHKVPPVEFDKLKDAAKQAGLSDVKANRVARAAQLLNSSFSELSEMRKILLNPATSAENADKIRQQLEEAAIQQHTQPNSQVFGGQQNPAVQGAGQVPIAVIESPPGQQKFQPNPNPTYSNPNLPIQQSQNQNQNQNNVNPALGPVPVPVQVPVPVTVPVAVPVAVPGGFPPRTNNIDPITLQRLNVSSTLAGLKANETNRFLRALVNSDLNATQASNLQNVMTEHAPTAEDLNKFTDILEKNATLKRMTADHAKVANSHGSEWLYSPAPINASDEAGQDRVARSFFDIGSNTNGNNINKLPAGNPRLFTAVRHCGVSPKYPVTQWTNVAPAQYPWSVAIFTSDDIFQCSGSLISENIVLTTASCVLKYRKTNLPLKLVVGAWDLPDDPLIGLPQVTIFAKSAVTHALYSESLPNSVNNIGLLRLTENIDFDLYPHIFPICIVSRSMLDVNTLSDQCTVTGWPQLLTLSNNRPPPKTYLAGANVTANANGCPTGGSSCISGLANIANEGSPVICPGSTQRFYQWGIVASEASGKRTDSSNLVTVSVVENYDFIARYLWT